MKGVMLVNMGGPGSREELRLFLSRMFKDPFILPYGKTVRNILSCLISSLRYKKSWKKYELIGGTPLVRSTEKTVASLQSALGDDCAVKYAFSYTMPDISACLNSFRREGISEITVIPLYPQPSFTTTSSVIAEVASVTEKDSFFRAVVRSGFYDHPGFVGFWTSLIREHLQANDIAGATLVFSAHSIPEYHIANGDIYASAIEKSAEFIADELGLRYKVVYQSGMRSGKWLGPEVKGYLTRMKEEGADNLVLIPISFVHENLETLYDLDQDIVPFAINSLGFKHVSRVSLPESDPLLVGMLAEMATRQDGLEMYV